MSSNIILDPLSGPIFLEDAELVDMMKMSRLEEEMASLANMVSRSMGDLEHKGTADTMSESDYDSSDDLDDEGDIEGLQNELQVVQNGFQLAEARKQVFDSRAYYDDDEAAIAGIKKELGRETKPQLDQSTLTLDAPEAYGETKNCFLGFDLGRLFGRIQQPFEHC